MEDENEFILDTATLTIEKECPSGRVWRLHQVLVSKGLWKFLFFPFLLLRLLSRARVKEKKGTGSRSMKLCLLERPAVIQHTMT